MNIIEEDSDNENITIIPTITSYIITTESNNKNANINDNNNNKNDIHTTRPIPL